VAEPITDPTPNSVMTSPASPMLLCMLWVIYMLIKGTTIVLALLISMTALSSQVSFDNPLKEDR